MADGTIRPRRRRGAVAPMLLAGGLVLGACSGAGTTNLGAGRNKRHNAVATTTGSDSAALCAIFGRLAASGAGPGAQFKASTAEAWEQRIATTAEIAAAAPPEWRDEARTYLQMVKDRAQLAAENGYVGVNDLPPDVRNAFISSHRTMQAQVDKLIAYMKDAC